MPPDLGNRSVRAMPISAVTPPGKRSSTRFAQLVGRDDRRRRFCSAGLASLSALPSTVKSRSRTGKPPSMSRMAPPVRNRLTPAAAASSCISPTTRNCSALRWLSSMNM